VVAVMVAEEAGRAGVDNGDTRHNLICLNIWYISEPLPIYLNCESKYHNRFVTGGLP
jgi:hypothetical protein